MRAIALLCNRTRELRDLTIEVSGGPPIDRSAKELDKPEKGRQLVTLAQFLDDAPERIILAAEMIERNIGQLRTALFG